MKFKYWSRCLEMDGELIRYVADRSRAVQVSYRTFARRCDLVQMRRETHPAMYRISCSNNWTISFWRSQLPSGVQVYFFDWSRIEHVFVDRSVNVKKELDLLTGITPSL
jgi:hypothetical protein